MGFQIQEINVKNATYMEFTKTTGLAQMKQEIRYGIYETFQRNKKLKYSKRQW